MRVPSCAAFAITAAGFFASSAATHAQGVVEYKTAHASVSIDLASGGRVSIAWPGGAKVLNTTAAVRVDGDELLASEFPVHTAEPAAAIDDAFGKGTRLTVRHTGRDGVELTQIIQLYDERPEVYIRLDVSRIDGTIVSTNHIAPLLLDARGATLALPVPVRQILSAPFDNDGYSRYDSTPAKDGITRSSEFTALYDDASRKAIIVGSATHDTWKTGIEIGAPSADGAVTSLRIFGGAADERTHDREPHGAVSGKTVSSPTIFVGGFDDWRDGLIAYGKANALVRPTLPWTGGVPLGWNSWAAHKSELTVEKVEAATEMVDALRKAGFENDGTAYVNLDSFWDKLNDAQLKTLIDDAHQRGLKFGLYWTPFCFWGDENALSRTVENTDGRYTFADLVLRGADGMPLHRNSGAYALDPTHPGTRARNDALYARFVALGIDFVKLDFITHGALEGKHFDTAIQTGIQAYHVGMSDMLAALGKADRPIFVSLSIAPLFPHGYGHARRMTCDVFASLDATKYLLNGLTYSFWTHGTLYRFNDPDHAVVYRVHDEKDVSETIGRTRFNASLISGGMLLNSDDATNESARARVAKLFTDPSVVSLAKNAATFVPIDGNTGGDGSAAYVLKAQDAVYLAVFNFDEKASITRQVSLARLGCNPDERYRVVNIQTNAVIAESAGDLIELDLAPAESRIVRLEKR
jgi:hypothetical protein